MRFGKELMRVLWICNVMLPAIAKKLGEEATNKEGWITGLMDAVLQYNTEQPAQAIQLGIAFPVGKDRELLKGELTINQDYDVLFYGFRENVLAAEHYDLDMEADMKEIMEAFKPDIVHCFGTEYPHTLAAVKVFGRPEHTLIGIQGLCRVYARGYMANLPKKVRRSVTFRDLVKKDTLIRQQQKYEDRGQWEMAAVQGTKHVTGRTHWDAYWTKKWNPAVTYHVMQETLRKEFYTGQWDYEACRKHRIFLSQGDYPIKGLHYVLTAMPEILKAYPDTEVYVAGNSIMREKSIKGRLKISAYARYLEKLIEQNQLQDKIHFTGKLDAARMKQQYLESHIFLCPSTMENSPNSLGEAMLLGVPVVSADIGGISSMMEESEGTYYRGFRAEQDEDEEELMRISLGLAEAVKAVFSDPEEAKKKAALARKHAQRTHDGKANNKRLLEIYQKMLTT